MPPFDKVIIALDENPTYYEFLPVTAKAWKNLFGITINICLVTNASQDSPLYQNTLKYANVHLFRPNNIPNRNYTRLTRWFIASSLPNSVCVINDIDTIPLQRDWFLNLLKNREPGQMLCSGIDLYEKYGYKNCKGKCPSSYTTAEGSVFHQIVNPLNLYFPQWVESICEMPILFDEKENPLKEDFSDESLLRKWVALSPHRGSVKYLPRGYDDLLDVCVPSVNGAPGLPIDRERLFSGGYVESHAYRPIDHFPLEHNMINEYLDTCKPL